MAITDSIVNFRRFLKRRNFSPHTVKNYLNSLRHFVLWLKSPIEQATHKEVVAYIDHLIDKGLNPETINAHLNRIRQFYHYLRDEEQAGIVNPVKSGCKLRVPRPLPKHLHDAQAKALLEVPKRPRDQAMFLLMLRCGVRVEEVANLSLDVIDFKRRRIIIRDGKWGKDRVVHVSNDALEALVDYLRIRPSSRTRKVFLVEKGTYRGQPISVRGIQKRMEYYAKKCGLKTSCHHLRHHADSRIMPTNRVESGALLTPLQFKSA
jgi:site-specific recombinase XerD